jgi:hypothetical protein
MQKATDRGSADGALVGLHSHDLTAVNTQAHVSAWQHNCIFCRSVAYHALLLTFVCNVGCIIINSIDVVQVHDLIVVQQLLFNEFVTQ